LPNNLAYLICLCNPSWVVLYIMYLYSAWWYLLYKFQNIQFSVLLSGH
jgi:hypothetical protein